MSHQTTVNNVSSISIYILKIEFNLEDRIRSSRSNSGSGEACARPKVTGNITAKEALLPDVNEKFNIEYFTTGKYLELRASV